MKAKREDLELEPLEFDDGLDFPSFDSEEIDGQVDPALKGNKRHPVIDAFKGTISGATDLLTNRDFLVDAAESALPREYGTIFKTTGDVATSVTRLYDDAVREVKPQLARVAKKIDKIAPKEGRIKNITSKIAGWFGDETDHFNEKYGKQEIQDQSINVALGQIFASQQQSEEDSQKREAVESRVKETIDHKRFTSSIAALSSIDDSAARLSNYTEKVTQAYQKKSLELQFRSYFVQNEQLQTTQKFFEIFKNQNDAITKNTALPEFVKITSSERFREVAKTKFSEGVYSSIFGAESPVGKAIARLKSDAMDFVEGIKDGIETGMMALDGIEQVQEVNEMMREMGGEEMTLANTAGRQAGSWAANKGKSWVVDKLKPHIDKNEKITEFGYKAANAIANPSGYVNEIRKNQRWQEIEAEDGKLAKVGNYAMGLFRDGGVETTIDNPYSDKNLNQPNAAGFDNKAHRSLTDIIPGYLARILQQVTAQRTGEVGELSTYDHSSGRFVGKSEMKTLIDKRLGKRLTSGSYDHSVNTAHRDLFQGVKLDPEQELKTKRFLSELSTIDDLEFNAENIRDSQVFKNLDQKTQKKVSAALEANVENTSSKSKSTLNLNRNIRSIRDQTTDIRGEIEALINLGHGEELESLGLTKRKEDDSYDVQLENYYEYLRNKTLKKKEEPEPEPVVDRRDFKLPSHGTEFEESAARSFSWPHAPQPEVPVGPDAPKVAPLDPSKTKQSRPSAEERLRQAAENAGKTDRTVLNFGFSPTSTQTGFTGSNLPNTSPTNTYGQTGLKYSQLYRDWKVQNLGVRADSGIQASTDTSAADVLNRTTPPVLTAAQNEAIKRNREAAAAVAFGRPIPLPFPTGGSPRPPQSPLSETDNRPDTLPQVETPDSSILSSATRSASETLAQSSLGEEPESTAAQSTKIPAVRRRVLKDATTGKPYVIERKEVVDKKGVSRSTPYRIYLDESGKRIEPPADTLSDAQPDAANNPAIASVTDEQKNKTTKPTHTRSVKTIKSNGKTIEVEEVRRIESRSLGDFSIELVPGKGKKKKKDKLATDSAQDPVSATPVPTPEVKPEPGVLDSRAIQRIRDSHMDGVRSRPIGKGGTVSSTDVEAGAEDAPGKTKRKRKPKASPGVTGEAVSDFFSKENIKKFSPTKALNSIKKTNIFKWNYKPGKGHREEEGATEQQASDDFVGPMAQDVRQNFGDEVAPKGKKIDLVSLNGAAMASIKALSEKVDTVAASVKEKFTRKAPSPEDPPIREKIGKAVQGVKEKITQKVPKFAKQPADLSTSLLKAISENIKKLVKLAETGRPAVAGAGIAGPGAYVPAAHDGSYGTISKNILGSVGNLIAKTTGDLFTATKKTVGFTVNKIITPSAKGAANLAEKATPSIKAGIKSIANTAWSAGAKLFEVSKDVLFDKLPKGAKLLGKAGTAIKDAFVSFYNDVRDVYIPGKAEPVLRAMLLRAGHYKDSVTGKVIKTMADLADIKGNIINQAGEVVLTIEDASKGIYDQYGSKIKGSWEKLSSSVIGYGVKGFNRGKKFLAGAFDKIKNLAGGAKNKVGSWFDEGDSWYSKLGVGIIGSGDKIHEVLVEIRDILQGSKKPVSAKDKQGKKKPAKTVAELETPEDPSVEKSTIDEQAKPGFYARIKNKARLLKDRIAKSATEDAAKDESKADSRPDKEGEKIADLKTASKEKIVKALAAGQRTVGMVRNRFVKGDEKPLTEDAAKDESPIADLLDKEAEKPAESKVSTKDKAVKALAATKSRVGALANNEKVAGLKDSLASNYATTKGRLGLAKAKANDRISTLVSRFKRPVKEEVESGPTEAPPKVDATPSHQGASIFDIGYMGSALALGQRTIGKIRGRFKNDAVEPLADTQPEVSNAVKPEQAELTKPSLLERATTQAAGFKDKIKATRLGGKVAEKYQQLRIDPYLSEETQHPADPLERLKQQPQKLKAGIAELVAKARPSNPDIGTVEPKDRLQAATDQILDPAESPANIPSSPKKPNKRSVAAKDKPRAIKKAAKKKSTEASTALHDKLKKPEVQHRITATDTLLHPDGPLDEEKEEPVQPNQAPAPVPEPRYKGASIFSSGVVGSALALGQSVAGKVGEMLTPTEEGPVGEGSRNAPTVPDNKPKSKAARVLGKGKGFISKGLGILSGSDKIKPEDKPEESKEQKNTQETEAPQQEVKAKDSKYSHVDGAGRKKPGRKRKQMTVRPVTSKPAFNDRDGSGKRDGAWEDRVKQLEERKAANAKAAVKADLTPQYKSDKNIIDTMMEKAGAVFDFLKTAASGLFGGIGSLVSGAADLLGLRGTGGIMSKVLGLAKAPFKLAGGLARGAMGAARAVGTPLVSGVRALSGARGVATAVNIASKIRTAAMVGSLMTGGVGSAVMGALSVGITAIGSALASPVVLGAAAIAATAYAGYKLYKYVTRNDANEFDDIRLKQYGLGMGDATKSLNHYIFKLEDYLQDGRIGYVNGQAYLLDKKIEKQDLLDIFSIDKDDDKMASSFSTWFGSRFKPFFLTHLTALFAIDPKSSLTKVSGLKPQEQIKYLNAISFEGGPYSVDATPFKEYKDINTDKTYALDAIRKLTEKLTAKLGGKDKKPEPPKPELDKPKEPKADPATAPKAESAVPAVAAKTLSPESKDKSGAMNGSMGLDQSTGEDGNVKEDKKPTSDAAPAGGGVSSGAAAGSGKLVQAAGPLATGENAGQYIKTQKGVDVSNLNQGVLSNFKAMVQEFGEKTGSSIQVNSGFRDRAKQEALYRENPKMAAKPGRSLHEYGLAFDANSADLGKMEDLGLMRKYGFTRPVGGEPWHVEPAGIQVNLQKAKDDANWAAQAVDASVGKGGGGLGTVSVPAEKKGKRDSALAVSLLDAPAKTVSATDKDKAVDKLSGNKATSGLPPTSPGPQGATALPSQPVSKEAKTESAPASAPSVAASSPKPVTGSEKAGSVSPVVADSTKSASTAQRGGAAPSVKESVDQSQKYSKLGDVSEGEKKPNNTAAASSGAAKTPMVAGNKESVKKGIEAIAKKQGENPELMKAFAAVESSLNPQAQAKGSSAAGLFQFTSGTWKEQVQKHGKKYDITPQTPPTDPEASTLMATEYIKQNRKAIQSVKPEVGLTDLYLAHFLGTGGARKFLKADPGTSAALSLPNAAAANPGIFYENKAPLTVGQVYDNLAKKLTNTSRAYGIDPPIGGSVPQSASVENKSNQGSTVSGSDTTDSSESKPKAPTAKSDKDKMTPAASTASVSAPKETYASKSVSFGDSAAPESNASSLSVNAVKDKLTPAQAQEPEREQYMSYGVDFSGMSDAPSPVETPAVKPKTATIERAKVVLPPASGRSSITMPPAKPASSSVSDSRSKLPPTSGSTPTVASVVSTPPSLATSGPKAYTGSSPYGESAGSDVQATSPTPASSPVSVRPKMIPTQPTLISQGEMSQSSAQPVNSKTLSTIDATLTQQLTVQTQMLEMLKKLVTQSTSANPAASSQEAKAATDAPAQSAPKAQPAPAQRPTGIRPAIDLSRRVS